MTASATETAVREAVRAKIYAMPLDKIVGQPTTATANHLKEQIAKIAAAIKTTKWGGRHGHLPLVLSDTEWQTASGVGATFPDGTANNTDRQPQPPLIPAGLTNNMTHINRETIKSRHDLANINFWTQEAVDDISVERIVQDIVDEMYVEELDEDYVGYSNQTIKTILTHIKDNWCIITTLEKKQAAENFRVQWDATSHITKYARELDKQQRLCRDIGIPAPGLTKIQYYVENMYASEMFDEKEMNTWENKPSADKDWTNAKAYFEDLYRSKRKYMEEREARASGFESANSISQRTKATHQPTSSAASFLSTGINNSPPGSVYAGKTATDQQTYIEYTNSLEGALVDAKEHVAAITNDRDRMMEKINEQQKLMMEQQQKFMEMMLSAGIGKPTKADGGAAKVNGGAEKTRSNRGTPGKAVPTRKCGVCGKNRVTHRDEDCWEDDRNASKRLAWHPKYKSKE